MIFTLGPSLVVYAPPLEAEGYHFSVVVMYDLAYGQFMGLNWN